MNPKILKYDILRAESANELVRAINMAMTLKNWQPLGAAVCVAEGEFNNTLWYQTMVEYESQDE